MNQDISTPLSLDQYEYLKTDYDKFVQEYSANMKIKINERRNPFRYSWVRIILQVAVMALTVFTEKYFKGKSEFLVQLSVWVGIIVFIYTILVQPMLFILYHSNDQKKLKKEMKSTLHYLEFHNAMIMNSANYEHYLSILHQKAL